MAPGSNFQKRETMLLRLLHFGLGMCFLYLIGAERGLSLLRSIVREKGLPCACRLPSPDSTNDAFCMSGSPLTKDNADPRCPDVDYRKIIDSLAVSVLTLLPFLRSVNYAPRECCTRVHIISKPLLRLDPRSICDRCCVNDIVKRVIIAYIRTRLSVGVF